ncbi:glutathione S-transferase family protein [Microvirga tunisiensis]|jgi:glutathione S-transferase|uniref:Glutathione S-transferase family protein n=1 Tax=Microvirga tunisiensis TaxID=2108360 RepID=A0A5N7MD11_9HYPH|nr:glutathione S-transferase family protein [Microvirga tunisiensis]MPR06436.1 glutathione S-transferase family protein [Microvirga tunisiensis]MPR24558.1 glutathione S-transferase family protein [Microvirga tunisiensis]
MPTLVIANKCYSSWSMRPWLLLKQLGIAFDELTVPLDLPDTKARVLKHSPAGKVPILIDGDVTVWETIAIMEYVGEAYGAPVWPADRKARAMARSIAAEMHSGFSALRSACPMNLGKKFAQKDRGEAVARDVARFVEIVRQAREHFGAGGPFLFGAFSAADAMYAPLVTRLDTYSIALDATTRAYADAILILPAFQEWRSAAMEEEWIVEADEVDEEAIEDYRKAA